MITILSGGTGGAKFVEGLQAVLPPKDTKEDLWTSDL